MLSSKKIVAFALTIIVLPVITVLVAGIARSHYLPTAYLPGSGLESANTVAVPIATGNGISMVITEDGSLWSWGWNNKGQLGDGTDIDQHYPVKIMEDMVAVSLNVGDIMFSRVSNTLIATLTSDGTLLTWGVDIRDKDFGIPFDSDGPRSFRYLSTPLEVMKNVSSFSAGSGHLMAITSDNTLWGMGVGAHRRAGIDFEHSPEPIQVMENVVAVSTGSEHTLAITSCGVLWAMGNNSSGQLGVAESPPALSFVPIRVMDDAVAVSAGSYYSTAITSDGILWAWGFNWFGQLGNGTTQNSHFPIKIMDDMIAVSAARNHTMAIRSDGTLWAWGLNESGQLGDGTTENRYSPVQIMYDVVYVSAGNSHTMAVTSDGVLWAWGRNSIGSLGDGTTEDRHTPVRIMDGVKLP